MGMQICRKQSKFWFIPFDVLQDVVFQCDSFRDVLSHYGYSRKSGAMTKTLRRVFDERGIDYSHFNTGRNGSWKIYTLDEIFVKNSPYRSQERLKLLLVQNGLLNYKCDVCGNVGEWNGKKLVLELDHIDGDNTNCELNNLRFLCPNCHSQTITYCRQKHSGRSKKLNCCIDCGKVIKNSSVRCYDCERKNRRHTSFQRMPVSRIELRNLVRTKSFVDIGKSYGVSDTTVRRWCRKYGLPCKRRDIQRISDDEWMLL